MSVEKDWKPVGVLHRHFPPDQFQVSAHVPASPLTAFVQYYWWVRWDLRGQPPFHQENLPHPNVHLVFDPGKTYVVGVIKGKFDTVLREKSQAFGVRFRPGGFYPFYRQPVASLTGRTLSLEALFGVETLPLEQAVLSETTVEPMIEIVEKLLLPRLPEPDPKVDLVSAIVEMITRERMVTRVEEIAVAFEMKPRTLQQLFHQYVGVSPKWVIQRARMHDTAEMIVAGGSIDWTALALKLGYFDQAHFIKAFKTLMGVTPADYVRQIHSQSTANTNEENHSED